MTKTKTFATLKAEIAVLEAQAAEARRREVSEVLKDIKSKIVTYGITAADLGFKGGTLTAPKTARKVSTAGVVKYRDPKSGKTWTGHGRAPDWLAKARNRDAFLVGAPPTTSTPTPTPAVAPVKAATKTVAVKAKKPAAKTAKPIRLALARNVAKTAAKKSAVAKPVAKKVVAKKGAGRAAVAAPVVAEPAAQAA